MRRARASFTDVTAADRRAAIGLDDRALVLAGIPLLSAVTSLLLLRSQPTQAPGLRAYAECFAVGLVYTSAYWLLLREAIVRVRRQRFLRRHTGLRLAALLAIAAALIYSVRGLSAGLLGGDVGGGGPSDGFVVAISLVLCAAMLAVYESVYFYAKYRDGLVTQERMARAEMQSQLVNLREQVNPHFLFNSLNTLASVIPEDPALATRFVQRLSAVYRRVLDHGLSETVTLGEELDALDDYLFLLETRFEDKLRVEIAVAPEERRLRVVPLALQLLVENAVKHNVVSERRPLSIRIVIAEGGIRVGNALQPRRCQVESAGVGLANLRQRYGLLGAGEMCVERTADAFAVTLPLLPEDVPRKAAVRYV